MEGLPEAKEIVRKFYSNIYRSSREDVVEFLEQQFINRVNMGMEYILKVKKMVPNEAMEMFFVKKDPEFIQEIQEYAAKQESAEIQKELVSHYEKVDANGVNVGWVDVPNVDKKLVLMHLHGGGYTSGDIENILIAHRIAKAANIRGFMVDYRLAPKHPFPEGLKDVVTAYKWLLTNNFQPNNILISGDSAGGGLALALLLKLRDSNITLPAGAICLSPWTDLTLKSDSYKTNLERDPTLDMSELHYGIQSYIGNSDIDPENPYISPVYANLAGLPPLLIEVGEIELLRDDAIRVAKRAKDAGVNVILNVYNDMPHVFQNMDFSIPEVKVSFNRINQFILSLLN